MPLPFVPGAARVAFSGLFNGLPWVNVMHVIYDGSGPLDVSEVNALALGMHTNYATEFIPLFATNCHLDATDVVDLDNVNGLTANYQHTDTGTTSGASVPVNTCVLVSWKGSERYRGGKARTYLPGLVASNMLNANALTSTALGNYQTAATAFKSNIPSLVVGSRTIDLAVIHYFRGPPAGTPLTPPHKDQIQSALVRAQLSTQRRRFAP